MINSPARFLPLPFGLNSQATAHPVSLTQIAPSCVLILYLAGSRGMEFKCVQQACGFQRMTQYSTK